MGGPDEIVVGHETGDGPPRCLPSSTGAACHRGVHRFHRSVIGIFAVSRAAGIESYYHESLGD